MLVWILGGALSTHKAQRTITYGISDGSWMSKMADEREDWGAGSQVQIRKHSVVVSFTEPSKSSFFFKSYIGWSIFNLQYAVRTFY